MLSGRWVLHARGSDLLIFQYGSNTSSDRLNSADRLRGDARDLGLARTRDHHILSFTVWSDSNECAAADLIPGGDTPAWGVLYEIPDFLVIKGQGRGRKTLDGIEGPRYERVQIEIVPPANGPLPIG